MMINKEYLFDLNRLVATLRQKKVIAYPTESVFGLGCDPDSEKAVHALLTLKQRPWQKGLILVAANYAQLARYVDDRILDAGQRAPIFSHWPGPITWVMPARATTPSWLTGACSSLAVRVTAFEPIQRLCLKFRKPLVSTSANLNGHSPARTVDEVRRQFGDLFPIMKGLVEGRPNPSEIRNALSGELIRQS